MPDVAITLAAVLAEAGSRLEAAGIATPGREALRIWADQQGREPGRAYLERSRPVTRDDAAAFLALVERRAAGEPLAYVTVHAGAGGDPRRSHRLPPAARAGRGAGRDRRPGRRP